MIGGSFEGTRLGAHGATPSQRSRVERQGWRKTSLASPYHFHLLKFGFDPFSSLREKEYAKSYFSPMVVFTCATRPLFASGRSN